MPQDYMQAYEAISKRLKKRFGRKPNYQEAAVQYSQLALELRREGSHTYAAFCLQAVARCERAMADVTLEAEANVEAGQLYLRAELENAALNFSGFDEFCAEAVQCYLLAVDTYISLGRLPMAATLLLELAGSLMALRRPHDAVLYLRKAATLQQIAQSTLAAIHSLESAAETLMAVGDFDVALELLLLVISLARRGSGGGDGGGGDGGVSDEAGGRPHSFSKGAAGVGGAGAAAAAAAAGPGSAGGAAAPAPAAAAAAAAAAEGGEGPCDGESIAPIPASVRREVLARVRVTGVLLLMLLQPQENHPDGLQRELFDSFDQATVDCVDEESVLLVQSLMAACRAKRLDWVRALQKDLYPRCNGRQNELLHQLLVFHATIP